MPEEFDPLWEYWQPDPEIAEVMGACVPDGFDGIVEFTDDCSGRSYVRGIRFGMGNPDFCRFRLAPAKPEREQTPRETRVCGYCGEAFRPRCGGSEFCSRGCYGDARRLNPKLCPTCGDEFQPQHSSGVYCSRKCSPKCTRSLPDRTCANPVCGKLFRPKASRTIYCSIRCVRHPGAPKGMRRKTS